ncbi:methylenetetrahydrofolate reductase [Buchnera aphidicola (Neophyllaphis varicolor)]|uniref:methylenetetrahydrofolate reductase n=1 Tax=Buchnera aphidicola TaxID=9 RepID=UPI0031B80981
MHVSYSHYIELLYYNLLYKNNKKINFSFEFFPPKNNKMESCLWNSINQLTSFKPKFFSVTYGANSGEKHKTSETVYSIMKKTGINTAAHLTCIDSNKNELINIAKNYWKNGVNHIIALRGDSFDINSKPRMHAIDLVYLLKEVADFDISVAGYPEVHPEANNSQYDLVNLKNKVQAGANRVITQFFFDTSAYLRFRDRCAKIGINVEIIPGILPIYNFNQIKKFASTTNVKIPLWAHKIFGSLENSPDVNKILSAHIVINMISVLCSEGIQNFHFYTLNKSEIIYPICHLLKSNTM